MDDALRIVGFLGFGYWGIYMGEVFLVLDCASMSAHLQVRDEVYSRDSATPP